MADEEDSANEDGANEYGANEASGPVDADELTAEDAERVEPPVVGASDAEVGRALAEGAIVAVPGVGGYSLAVLVGSSGGEGRLDALAADPEGPHYVVGHSEDVRVLTSGWSDEVRQLLDRCWPGPVEVFLPRSRSVAEESGEAVDDSGGWAVTVGMPDGRALRRLCREHGPWRTVPLNFTEASEVAHHFDAADVALVVDGGRREGERPTLVDATMSPVRVLREGVLPANFIDATMAMSARKRWFSRPRRDAE